MDFVHLHTHSDYSCLQSLAPVSKLLERCAAYNMPGMALTDLGNLYGAMEFFDLASRANINPIIGCEFYIQSAHFKESSETVMLSRNIKRKVRLMNRELSMPYGIYKIVLLAETDLGYKNLMQLSTLSHDRSLNKFPILTLDELFKHRAGLICLSGGMGSELFDMLRQKNYRSAQTFAKQFIEIFGPEHYFLEIQDHDHATYRAVTESTIELAEKLQAPLVVCNEVHYLDKDDWYSHEIMLCIAGSHLITEKKGFTMADRPCLVGTGYHFKSEQEILAHFEHVPEAIKNTRRINDRCSVNIHDKTFHMPKFTIPDDGDPAAYIRDLVATRLKVIFKNQEIPELYWDRIADELEVITSMGFAEYFLIVSDLIDAAKERSILVGPGRGSIVGSLVAYALGITDLDPIQYDLLFERFLTKGRISMPDIDIDFQDDRRDEVIDYIRTKYGTENTCQIITYARLKARAVFKDVCRVFNVDYQISNRLSNLISSRVLTDDEEGTGEPLSSLQASYQSTDELKEQIFASEQLKQVYLHSLKLENLIRQTGLHAAGVVIADKPLSQYIPLAKNEEAITVSQYDGRFLESHCGLLKMDVLGLRTLSLIKKAIEEIRVHENQSLDWREFPLEDKRTFKFFAKGMTVGIFQFESDGMTRYLRELNPSGIEELIAMNALYRPGPIAWISVYIAKKHNRTPTFQSAADKKRYEDLEKLCARFDLLRKILDPTRFLPVFQEQIMQICRVFAGFSLAEADNIRKAMGKKDKKLITSLRTKFIDGANRLGHKEVDAVFLYDEIIESFAGYGFNKSHSAGYAILAYRVAYIKANYTAYFMAAFLNSEIGHLREAKMRRVFQECAFNKITILPPDINTATTYFQNRHGTISFAFNAIKGVGRHVAAAIVSEREKGVFTSFSNFLRRMTQYAEQTSEEGQRMVLNKQVVEALIKVQCFDSLYTPQSIQKNDPTYVLEEEMTHSKSGAKISTKTSAEISATAVPSAKTGSSDGPALLSMARIRADVLLKFYPNIQSVIDAEANMYKGGQQSLFARPLKKAAKEATPAASSRDPSDDREHSSESSLPASPFGVTSPYVLEQQTIKTLKWTSPSHKDALKTLEKEGLAFNFREDPTLRYTKVFKELTSFDVNLPTSWRENDPLTLAGILEEVMVRFTKKNNDEMGILKINNGLRIFEGVCFPSTWKKLKAAGSVQSESPAPPSIAGDQDTSTPPASAFVLDAPVKITGFFKKSYGRSELLSIVVNQIAPITRHDPPPAEHNESTKPSHEKKLVITLTGDVTPETLMTLKRLLETSPKGNQKVYLSIQEASQESGRRRTLFLGNALTVQFTETLRHDLKKMDVVSFVELVS